MSLLKWLGFDRDDAASAEDRTDETETVRKIVSELKALPRERARFVAAYAYILSRVAYADSHISDEEVSAMEELVSRFGKLPEAQAVLAVEIARNQATLFGGTENYLVTREFKNMSSREEREDLLHCMFAVSAADNIIDSSEEAVIRQAASELGFTQSQYVDIRSAYNDKRAVVKLGKQKG